MRKKDELSMISNSATGLAFAAKMTSPDMRSLIVYEQAFRTDRHAEGSFLGQCASFAVLNLKLILAFYNCHV